MRRFDATLDEIPRRIRLQVLGGVIRLLRPILLDQLDPAPLDDGDLAAAAFAEDDQGRPARMSFEAEGDVHDVTLSKTAGCRMQLRSSGCRRPGYARSPATRIAISVRQFFGFVSSGAPTR